MEIVDLLASPEAWIALVTLVVMDNGGSSDPSPPMENPTSQMLSLPSKRAGSMTSALRRTSRLRPV